MTDLRRLVPMDDYIKIVAALHWLYGLYNGNYRDAAPDFVKEAIDLSTHGIQEAYIPPDAFGARP